MSTQGRYSGSRNRDGNRKQGRDQETGTQVGLLILAASLFPVPCFQSVPVFFKSELARADEARRRSERGAAETSTWSRNRHAASY